MPLIRAGRVIFFVFALVVGLGFAGYHLFFAEQEMAGAVSVGATFETAQVTHEGDAADDPAIWVHPTDPALSVILGTDKKGGMGVYDLSGHELQYLADGHFNNVDLRSDVAFRGDVITLVVAGEKQHEQLVFYKLLPDARVLMEIPDARFNVGVDPEGVCLYRSGTGAVHVFVSGEDLKQENRFWVEQWRIHERPELAFGVELVRRLEIGTQTEGLVADDELGHLYVAEENVGVWKYSASPDRSEESTQAGGPRRVLVDRTGAEGRLSSDVEGLTIFYGDGDEGFLIASSQGSDDFVVYRREGENEYVGRFKICSLGSVDEVTHTDGIDVSGVPMGKRFPGGVFVAQDDENDRGLQNFKIVSWQQIAEVLEISG